MGAVCCCLQSADFEDYVNPNSSVYRNCSCLRCFVQNFVDAAIFLVYILFNYVILCHLIILIATCWQFNYALLFRRGEVHALPSSIEGAASMTSTASHDNSLSDMYRSPPRPLPYDADPRCFRLQRDGLVSRREKGASQSHEESEPLRRSGIDAESESLSTGDKWNGSACEEGSKENHTKSSLKVSSTKPTTESWHLYSSSDDEDVCPTCLEEYTLENPKILTKCSHHFHLGCIFEWMERSESCPVCGKVMVFNETT